MILLHQLFPVQKGLIQTHLSLRLSYLGLLRDYRVLPSEIIGRPVLQVLPYVLHGAPLTFLSASIGGTLNNRPFDPASDAPDPGTPLQALKTPLIIFTLLLIIICMLVELALCFLV